MEIINKKKLQSEFKFQQNFVKSDSSDFLKNYKEYLNEYKNEYNAEFYKNSGNFLYFTPKVDTSSNNSVLIVIHELSRTGAPVVAVDTAKILKDNGYFVTVIALKGGKLLEELTEYGIPVVIMNQFKYIQFMEAGSEHFVDSLDMDLFVQSFEHVIMITATLYNLIRRYMNSGKEIIWWIHEGSETYNILGRKMPKNLMPNIKVLCGGQYSADQTKKWGFNYHTEVLNYGVNDIGLLEKEKNNDKVVFLLAGTISTRKGQSILLEAVKRLSPEEKNKSEFVFIGDPYDGDIAGERIKEEIDKYCVENNNVKIYKSVSRDELFEIYKKIDVLVLASIDDPMPVVATENLMLGNIVLCSTGTGTSYYIKDKENGFVFNNGSVDELYEKIKYIINEKELDNIKKQGRKIFEQYFNMPIFKRNILQIIEEN